MAITNFIVTVAAVSAAVLLFRSDVRKSATIFRRNVRHIRNWLEEESASSAKSSESASQKELEGRISKKDVPKEDKQ